MIQQNVGLVRFSLVSYNALYGNSMMCENLYLAFQFTAVYSVYNCALIIVHTFVFKVNMIILCNSLHSKCEAPTSCICNTACLNVAEGFNSDIQQRG